MRHLPLFALSLLTAAGAHAAAPPGAAAGK
jgi:hypothetical protein